MHQPEQNKKSHSLELISRPEATTASQKNDAAKIQKKVDVAIKNLKNVAKIYEGIKDPSGFITNLKLALGITPHHASDYYVFETGNPPRSVSVRISNHNAKAVNYEKHRSADCHISIVVKGRRRTANTFEASDNVSLVEYVYMEKSLRSVENPYSKIAESIALFLENGYYNDATGVAKVNVSP
jgi:hypothetical protein